MIRSSIHHTMAPAQPIPHLKTTDVGPLSQIEKKIIDIQVDIEAWFRHAFQDKPSIITASVDIRNAGFKISPVDTNIFPAGYNNLSQDSYALAIQAFQYELSIHYRTCNKIVIIPESHTRNPHYFQSLATLSDLLTKAGFEVHIGSLIGATHTTLPMFPITLEDNTLIVNGIKPCVILLNNDLSDGIPEILNNIKQPIIPPPILGWKHRRKTNHFKFYAQVAEQFCTDFNIDPWLVTPLFEDCGEINFVERKGETCLYEKSKRLFKKIEDKYQNHQINKKPYIVVKSDQGTYGMAVMTIQDPEEILNLNRKKRQAMSRTKGGGDVTRVMIQEGVHTNEMVGDAVAEPVLYMVGQSVIGGFYRVHQNKGPEENLNSPGMHFEPLAFDECCNIPDKRISTHAPQNKFYVYSVIARLALLATCHEALAAVSGNHAS